MRRMALLTLLLVMAVPAAIATADSPNFKSATASGPDANGNLTVNFRETGLGNTGDPVNYTATADANALYACQNNGGNFPSDPKKQSATGPAFISPSGAVGPVPWPQTFCAASRLGYEPFAHPPGPVSLTLDARAI
jgi:hypothetical protein